MNDRLNSWIEKVPAFDGLVGVYVTQPDQPLTIQCYAEEYSRERMLSVHRQIQDVVDVLEAGRLPARRLRWIFHDTVVYFERRQDGAGMGLITSHDPWIGEGKTITRLIKGFREVS